MGDSYFGCIRHFIKEALITWGVDENNILSIKVFLHTHLKKEK
jgi:hypothetical protein